MPALIVAALLAARAFPLRPGVAGALYGLGCGLIADAGLRLYCEYTAPPARRVRARRGDPGGDVRGRPRGEDLGAAVTTTTLNR